ncbi:MAG: DegT/DnrJ/EryC1/StrS family aminotransferase [bacterium]|nr:DegT/DnrJ/EryC1/StrS family aminotransferase [bacterium]
MMFPLAKPHIGKKEEQAVLRVLRSGVLSIGPEIQKFEKAFAKFAGTKYACAVSSGTAGLHLSLIAAGIGKGDEVITPPFSFVASANAILYVGAVPVFADIDPVTYNIDPKEIEKKITKKTKAILVVHILGQAADMNPIMRIAKKHNLKVIEDACESIGATYRGRKVGTFGQSAVFAFYPNKQMTTGEGGMIVTNSKKADELFRSLRNQGRGTDRNWLSHTRLGYNYRLDEMSAALGLVQLHKIDFLIHERQKIAGWYHEFLSPFAPLVKTPAVAPSNTHTWFVYTVLLPAGTLREKVMKQLAKAGIASKPYLPAIHLFPFYRKQFGFSRGNFRVCEQVSERVLALPLYIGLKKGDVAYICRTLRNILS